MGMEIRVDLTGPLEEHVRIETGNTGTYSDAAEYVRDLIRRDRERYDEDRFVALRSELQRAFCAPESDYVEMDAEAFLSTIKHRAG